MSAPYKAKRGQTYKSSNARYKPYTSNGNYAAKSEVKSNDDYIYSNSLTKPDWNSMNLKPFKKNFLNDDILSQLKLMKNNKVNEWRNNSSIKVLAGYQEIMSFDDAREGNVKEIKSVKWDNDGVKTVTSKELNDKIPDIPNPILSFDECDMIFDSSIMNKIKEAKFTNPTPIQSQLWTMILSGNDVIGIAQTGSGKTLAFLLPGILQINTIKSDKQIFNPNNAPIMLVVAPTRELALQIDGEISKFSDIKHACIYGGAGNRDKQISQIQSGIDIAVATPGRLIDFMTCNVVTLHSVTYLVIDEADRLLDMGFEMELTKIIQQIRPDKQLILTSATWPKDVINMAKKFLTKSNNIFQCIIGNIELTCNSNIYQEVFILNKDFQKRNKLGRLINDTTKDNAYNKILVFCTRKKLCDKVGDFLWNQNYYVDVIHSGKNQMKRESIIKSFKNGDINILVATDVASRGIDIKDIKLVINYDPPLTIEDYVHRIGRTGRAGNKGKAIQFISNDDDVKFIKQLFWVLKKNGQKHALNNEILNMTGMRGVPGWEI